ncbi:MAG: M48 family metalloprotease [Pseudomonadales bacterium]
MKYRIPAPGGMEKLAVDQSPKDIRCMILSMKTLVTLISGIVLATSLFAATRVELPELGDTSSAIISPEAERRLGQEFLRQVRSQLPTIEDPILKYYTKLQLYELATHSQLKQVLLYPVLIDAKQINAWAAPGGIVGINLGLFLHAMDVHEYSSVLAHELAHLSQRHFARNVEAQQRMTLPTLIGFLVGAAIMATGSSEAGMAAMSGAQAIAQNQRLRYSRGREQEADRIGLTTLWRAGLDTDSMSRMFARMQRTYRFTERPPEFLLTHPVTERRITDARNQSARYEKKVFPDSLEYQLMRARARMHFVENGAKALEEAKNIANDKVIDDYTLALAYDRAGRHDEAVMLVKTLLQEDPGSILLCATFAELLINANEIKDALDLLAHRLVINPDNQPFAILYARALNASKRHEDAKDVLWRQASINGDDVDVWYDLAETAGLAGDIVGVHRARAEFFALNGDYQNAIQHLQYALSLVTKPSQRLVASLEQRLLDLRTQAEAARET